MSCHNKRSRERHFVTRDLENGLYLEVYYTYQGGVFAGDSYGYHLTDSTNFRIYIYEIIDGDHDRLHSEVMGDYALFYNEEPRKKTLVKVVNIPIEKSKGIFEQ